jgi:hypothetical protein
MIVTSDAFDADDAEIDVHHCRRPLRGPHRWIFFFSRRRHRLPLTTAAQTLPVPGGWLIVIKLNETDGCAQGDALPQ